MYIPILTEVQNGHISGLKDQIKSNQSNQILYILLHDLQVVINLLYLR